LKQVIEKSALDESLVDVQVEELRAEVVVEPLAVQVSEGLGPPVAGLVLVPILLPVALEALGREGPQRAERELLRQHSSEMTL
jgi:hypothetical protein